MDGARRYSQPSWIGGRAELSRQPIYCPLTILWPTGLSIPPGERVDGNEIGRTDQVIHSDVDGVPRNGCQKHNLLETSRFC
jgi:hypothetical protein